MRLSIIIPVYNVDQYIDRCLKNILNQGIPINEYEIILVNDGSSDRSVEIVNEFKKSYSNINLLHQENSGPGAARNTGIDNAKGDYIYFIDADDYLVENSLPLLLNCIEEKQLDLLGFETLRTSSFNSNRDSGLSTNIVLDFIGSGSSYVTQYNHRNECWWYFINRKYLLRTGFRFPKEKKLLEDVLFTQKLLLGAKKMGYTSSAIHRYFLRSSSTMLSKEPQHYYNLLWDYERVIYEFTPLIDKVKDNKAIVELEKLLKQLKSRQQSFVFFLIVRTLKYGMRFKEFKLLLKRLKKAKLYPIKDILYENHVKDMKVMIFLFNNKLFLYLISILFSIVAKLFFYRKN